MKRLVRERMNELNLNAHQLSKMMGVNHVTVGRIIHGEGIDIRLSTAMKLADALQVDLNDLVKEVEW